MLEWMREGKKIKTWLNVGRERGGKKVRDVLSWNAEILKSFKPARHQKIVFNLSEEKRKKSSAADKLLRKL